jgi:very-short-patch-repair endonuclease
MNTNFSKWFSEAEKNFFRVLTEIKPNHIHLFAKVRMQDIIWAPQGKTGYINSRHFDFVLTNSDFNILSVIELDDKSHSTKKQAQIDEKKNTICKCAGIKIHRIKAKRSYSIEEINSLFS